MNHKIVITLGLCAALLITHQTDASLIGDSIDVKFNNFPFVPTVLVVTPGVELPGASTATFGSGGATPRWDINIESNFMTIDIINGPATYGAGSRFTFSDLDWVGGLPGIVTGVTASSNQSIIPVSANFTPDSVTVFFGSNTDNWQLGDQIRVDLQTAHVPEPTSLALMGLSSALALIRRKEAPLLS